MINKKGDIGSPYLRPRIGLNIEIGVPFSSIKKYGEDIMERIQFIHLWAKP